MRIIQYKPQLLDYDSILFDLDGTLYDSERFYFGVFEQMAEWLVKKGTLKDKNVWIHCIMALKTAKGNDHRYLIDDCFRLLALDRDLKADILGIYHNHDCRYLVMENEEESVLEWLVRNNKSLMVITNGSTALQKKKMAALGLDRYIKAVIILDPECGGKLKPDPAAFHALNQKYDLGKSVMVGDRFDIDGQFARNAGIDFLSVGFYGN